MTKFKGHKTIKVEELKSYINELLANEKIPESEKTSYCFLLERVLFDTNNYKGWNNIPNAQNDHERRYYQLNIKNMKGEYSIYDKAGNKNIYEGT